MTKRIVLAITGASGAPIAVRLLQTLLKSDAEIHLTISPSGAAVIKQELSVDINLRRPDIGKLIFARPPWDAGPSNDHDGESTVGEKVPDWANRLHYHQYDDYMTPIASGSFRTDAMVVCPCSGSTLSGIARSAASNLVQRAAEVHLKEHRTLIVVPRETPMSVIQIENLHRAAQAGAIVLPAMPGWYHGVRSINDLVDFVVSRILDQLDVDNSLIGRWGE